MAKIARPAQETPEFLGQSLYYCTLIEKINQIFFLWSFSAIKKYSEEKLQQPTSTIPLQNPNITHSRKSKQFPHNRSYCMVEHICHHFIHLYKKYMCFLSAGIGQVA